jgi:hypothetical protein
MHTTRPADCTFLDFITLIIFGQECLVLSDLLLCQLMSLWCVEICTEGLTCMVNNGRHESKRSWPLRHHVGICLGRTGETSWKSRSRLRRSEGFSLRYYVTMPRDSFQSAILPYTVCIWSMRLAGMTTELHVDVSVNPPVRPLITFTWISIWHILLDEIC